MSDDKILMESVSALVDTNNNNNKICGKMYKTAYDNIQIKRVMNNGSVGSIWLEERHEHNI